MMDEHTRENWAKVKAALEEAGKTDCLFYRRAVAITSGKDDPFDPFRPEQSPQS